MLGLEWWLREYGVTPAQVREMPAWFVARVPHIANLRHEAQQNAAKK